MSPFGLQHQQCHVVLPQDQVTNACRQMSPFGLVSAMKIWGFFPVTNACRQMSPFGPIPLIQALYPSKVTNACRQMSPFGRLTTVGSSDFGALSPMPVGR